MRANIASRVSRLSYGIVIQEPFDENRHLEQDRKYQHALDMDCAMNQMESPPRWHKRGTSQRHRQLLSNGTNGITPQ